MKFAIGIHTLFKFSGLCLTWLLVGTVISCLPWLSFLVCATLSEGLCNDNCKQRTGKSVSEPNNHIFFRTRRRDATSDSEKNIKFAPYTRHNLETAITLLVLPIFLIHIKERSKTSDTTRCNTLRLLYPFSLANACLTV